MGENLKTKINNDQYFKNISPQNIKFQGKRFRSSHFNESKANLEEPQMILFVFLKN